MVNHAPFGLSEFRLWSASNVAQSAMPVHRHQPHFANQNVARTSRSTQCSVQTHPSPLQVTYHLQKVINSVPTVTTCLHTEQVLADRQPSIQKYNPRQAAYTLAHYPMSAAGAKTIQTYYTVNWSTIALKSAGRGATNSIISSRSGCSTCNSVECNITRGTVTPLSRLGLYP